MTCKKIILWSILATLSLHTLSNITIDSQFIKNCPDNYLVDLMNIINDDGVTLQIGQELYIRNYIYTTNTYNFITDTYDAKPTAPAYGYTADQGIWVWVADEADYETGMWVWIANYTPHYIASFFTLISS